MIKGIAASGNPGEYSAHSQLGLVAHTYNPSTASPGRSGKWFLAFQTINSPQEFFHILTIKFKLSECYMGHFKNCQHLSSSSSCVPLHTTFFFSNSNLMVIQIIQVSPSFCCFWILFTLSKTPWGFLSSCQLLFSLNIAHVKSFLITTVTGPSLCVLTTPRALNVITALIELFSFSFLNWYTGYLLLLLVLVFCFPVWVHLRALLGKCSSTELRP